MPYIPVAEGPRDASRSKFPKSPVSFIAEYILMYLRLPLPLRGQENGDHFERASPFAH